MHFTLKKDNNNNNNTCVILVCLMPQVHGMHPADERKDTSRDYHKGDSNNNNNNDKE